MCFCLWMPEKKLLLFTPCISIFLTLSRKKKKTQPNSKFHTPEQNLWIASIVLSRTTRFVWSNLVPPSPIYISIKAITLMRMIWRHFLKIFEIRPNWGDYHTQSFIKFYSLFIIKPHANESCQDNNFHRPIDEYEI